MYKYMLLNKLDQKFVITAKVFALEKFLATHSYKVECVSVLVIATVCVLIVIHGYMCMYDVCAYTYS